MADEFLALCPPAVHSSVHCLYREFKLFCAFAHYFLLWSFMIATKGTSKTAIISVISRHTITVGTAEIHYFFMLFRNGAGHIDSDTGNGRFGLYIVGRGEGICHIGANYTQNQPGFILNL